MEYSGSSRVIRRGAMGGMDGTKGGERESYFRMEAFISAAAGLFGIQNYKGGGQ